MSVKEEGEILTHVMCCGWAGGVERPQEKGGGGEGCVWLWSLNATGMWGEVCVRVCCVCMYGNRPACDERLPRTSMWGPLFGILTAW